MACKDHEHEFAAEIQHTRTMIIVRVTWPCGCETEAHLVVANIMALPHPYRDAAWRIVLDTHIEAFTETHHAVQDDAYEVLTAFANTMAFLRLRPLWLTVMETLTASTETTHESS